MCVIGTDYDVFGLKDPSERENDNNNNIAFPDDHEGENVDCEFPDDGDDANDEYTIPWRDVPVKKWQRVIGT